MSLGAVPTIAPARFAIIGYGAITEEIVNILAAGGDFRSLTGVLVRPGRVAPGRERAAGRFPVTDSIHALIAAKPDCVIECAGHAAWRLACLGDCMYQRPKQAILAEPSCSMLSPICDAA